MPRPSFSLLFSGLFISWIIYSIYSLSLLFVPPKCESGHLCLKSILLNDPKLQLHLFISPSIKTPLAEFKRIHSILDFNYTQQHTIPLSIEIPERTRHNGTLFLHTLVVPNSANNDFSFYELQKNEHAVYTRIKLTQFMVPEAEAFNLLGEKKSPEESEKVKRKNAKAVSHLKSRITFTMVTDTPELPTNLPAELIYNIKVTKNRMFLPIVNYDFLQSRHKDLVKITDESDEMNLTIIFTPISIGKLRLILHVKTALENVKQFGFSDKDVDEIKGIYADTNAVLLAGTIFIASMHMMFDFLAFKNDISFWRSKGSFEGLSVSTIVWRAFSQTVIFLYLLDENSSLLVLIPAGIGTLIEFWKTKKVLRIQLDRSGIIPKIKIRRDDEKQNKAESRTREFDAESLKYLSYVLYPLGIAGAVYSLIYQPHKSWYSWSINSLVNGVYAFGFLFMLPQLFVNYKLKSVAHLPWRAFMYKAFNTFIDDVFAFIITMPTAHRVACFRDDIVFLIYLYQRWLYPVDKNRIDSITISEEINPSVEKQKIDKKEN